MHKSEYMLWKKKPLNHVHDFNVSSGTAFDAITLLEGSKKRMKQGRKRL